MGRGRQASARTPERGTWCVALVRDGGEARPASRRLVQMAAAAKQVGGRVLSYLSVQRGRPPASY